MCLQPPGPLLAGKFPREPLGELACGQGRGWRGTNKEEGTSNYATTADPREPPTGEALHPLFSDVRGRPIPYTWKLRLRGLTACPKVKELVLAESGLRPRLLTPRGQIRFYPHPPTHAPGHTHTHTPSPAGGQVWEFGERLKAWPGAARGKMWEQRRQRGRHPKGENRVESRGLHRDP